MRCRCNGNNFFFLHCKYKYVLATEKLNISSPRPAFSHSQAMNKQASHQSPPASALKIVNILAAGT
jgi:hypothetical protein